MYPMFLKYFGKIIEKNARIDGEISANIVINKTYVIAEYVPSLSLVSKFRSGSRLDKIKTIIAEKNSAGTPNAEEIAIMA
jgi:hypothetical protein